MQPLQENLWQRVTRESFFRMNALPEILLQRDTSDIVAET